MRVIKPECRAAISYGWAGSLRNFPCIGVDRAGRDSVISLFFVAAAIEIGSSFGIFLIRNSMRVHAVGASRVVLEHDFDSVADLSANHRAQYAEVLPFRGNRLEGFEAVVGVFAKAHLAVRS